MSIASKVLFALLDAATTSLDSVYWLIQMGETKFWQHLMLARQIE